MKIDPISYTHSKREKKNVEDVICVFRNNEK